MNQSQESFETETNGNITGANNATSVYPYSYPQKKSFLNRRFQNNDPVNPLERCFKNANLNGEATIVINFLKEAERIALNSKYETKIGLVITQNNQIIFSRHINIVPIRIPSSVGVYRGPSNPNCKCFIVKGKVKHLNTRTPTDQRLTKELIIIDDLTKINIEYLFRKKVEKIFTWQQSNIKVAEIKDLIKHT